jgi:hypothetical protein
MSEDTKRQVSHFSIKYIEETCSQHTCKRVSVVSSSSVRRNPEMASSLSACEYKADNVETGRKHFGYLIFDAGKASTVRLVAKRMPKKPVLPGNSIVLV